MAETRAVLVGIQACGVAWSLNPARERSARSATAPLDRGDLPPSALHGQPLKPVRQLRSATASRLHRDGFAELRHVVGTVYLMADYGPSGGLWSVFPLASDGSQQAIAVLARALRDGCYQSVQRSKEV